MYKHDYAEEVYAKIHNKPNLGKITWPFKCIPDMGDVVRLRGEFYRVKFKVFIFSHDPEARPRIVIWIERQK